MRVFYSIFAIIFILTKPVYAGDMLKMVYSSNFPPFSWLDNNKPRGILIDIVEEVVVKRLKLPVSHHAVPWSRARYMIDHNKADGFVTIPTKKRQMVMNKGSIPLIIMEISMMVNAKHPALTELKKIDNVKQLKPFRVGAKVDNFWAEKNLLGLKYVKTRSVKQLLNMAVVDRVDIIIDADIILEHFRKQLGYSKEIILLPNSLESITLNLLIRKNSKYADFSSKFDPVLQQMIDDGSLEKIISQYR